MGTERGKGIDLFIWSMVKSKGDILLVIQTQKVTEVDNREGFRGDSWLKCMKIKDHSESIHV